MNKKQDSDELTNAVRFMAKNPAVSEMFIRIPKLEYEVYDGQKRTGILLSSDLDETYIILRRLRIRKRRKKERIYTVAKTLVNADAQKYPPVRLLMTDEAKAGIMEAIYFVQQNDGVLIIDIDDPGIKCECAGEEIECRISIDADCTGNIVIVAFYDGGKRIGKTKVNLNAG